MFSFLVHISNFLIKTSGPNDMYTNDPRDYNLNKSGDVVKERVEMPSGVIKEITYDAWTDDSVLPISSTHSKTTNLSPKNSPLRPLFAIPSQKNKLGQGYSSFLFQKSMGLPDPELTNITKRLLQIKTKECRESPVGDWLRKQIDKFLSVCGKLSLINLNENSDFRIALKIIFNDLVNISSIKDKSEIATNQKNMDFVQEDIDSFKWNFG